MAATGDGKAITATGRVTPFSGFKRHWLSNGWFIDGASRAAHHCHGWKYSLWEPGGDSSGCAGFRGGAPTLALALAIANGETLCGHAQLGCRKLATGHRTVQVRGREGRVYHCDDHRSGEER